PGKLPARSNSDRPEDFFAGGRRNPNQPADDFHRQSQMLAPGQSRLRDSAGRIVQSVSLCRARVELDNGLRWRATLQRCAAKAICRRRSKAADPPAIALRARRTGAEFAL